MGAASATCAGRAGGGPSVASARGRHLSRDVRGGGEDGNVPAYLLATGIGGAGIVGVSLLPWRTLFERGWGDAALYLWSASEADRLTMEPLERLAQVAGRALEHVSSFQQERDAVERLQRLDVLKGDFISNASHELRTPTTVVYGLVQTLATRKEQLDPEIRESILQRLVTASETLKDTITTLIDFARIESGQLAPRHQPVSLLPVVGAVLANLTEALADHLVSVDVAEDLSLEADPVLLDRSLDNLLVNAARYTPPGTAIRIRGRRQGEEIHLSVADDGPGIPLQEQEHLTDRFFRGGDPNTRTNRGLGVGLAFVRDVVAAHHGRLDIVSVPGSGSSFTIVLPQQRRTLVRQESAGPMTPTMPATSRRFRRLRATGRDPHAIWRVARACRYRGA